MNNGLARTGTGATARIIVVVVVVLRTTEVGAGGLVVVSVEVVVVVVVVEVLVQVVVGRVHGGCLVLDGCWALLAPAKRPTPTAVAKSPTANRVVVMLRVSPLPRYVYGTPAFPTLLKITWRIPGRA